MIKLCLFIYSNFNFQLILFFQMLNSTFDGLNIQRYVTIRKHGLIGHIQQKCHSNVAIKQHARSMAVRCRQCWIIVCLYPMFNTD